MIKKFLSMVAIAGMVFTTSCSSDEFEPAQNGGEAVVSFTTELPSSLQSRAFGDGTTAVNLSYFVYGEKEDGSWEYLPALSQEDVQMQDRKATVNLSLVNGEKYNVVFWADAYTADATGAPYTFVAADAKLTVNYENAAANDENRDAFYKVENFTVNGNMTRDVELKRPFAQINIGTTDWADVVKNTNVNITQTSIKVKAYSTLNFKDGDATDETTAEFELANMPDGETFPVENVGVDKYLAMNYILVDEKELVNVTINYNSDVDSRTFTGVPVQRNYRTNIYGKLITSDEQFNVEINPIFKGEYPDGSAEELEMMAKSGGSYTLTEDATMQYLNVLADFNLTIEEGVTFTSGDAANYGLIVRQGTTTIDGNGNYAAGGGAIAALNGAKVIFNGGNISLNCLNTSPRYIFYLYGEGSTAEINGGNFDFDQNLTSYNKRAYVYAGNGTTAYINGGTFGKASTRSGYTTGILTEGTGKVIITGGTFGFDPTTWVAEGYKAIKSGGNWVVVKENIDAVATTADELKAAINADQDVMLMNDLDLTSLVYTNHNVTIDLNGHTVKSATHVFGTTTAGVTLTVMNGTLETATYQTVAVYTSASDLNITLKNVTINETGDAATDGVSCIYKPGNFKNLTLSVEDSEINGPVYISDGFNGGVNTAVFKNTKLTAATYCNISMINTNLTVEGCDFTNTAAKLLDYDNSPAGNAFIEVKGFAIGTYNTKDNAAVGSISVDASTTFSVTEGAPIYNHLGGANTTGVYDQTLIQTEK